MISPSAKNKRLSRFPKIVVMIATAMVLSVVPMPESISLIRPDFVALILIYLCWYHTDDVGVFTGFTVGLLVDALTFGILGQHALAKVIVAYCAIRIRESARGATQTFQALIVLILLLMQSAAISVIGLFTNEGGGSLVLWITPLGGAVTWLVIALAGRLHHSIRNVPIK